MDGTGRPGQVAIHGAAKSSDMIELLNELELKDFKFLDTVQVFWMPVLRQ